MPAKIPHYLLFSEASHVPSHLSDPLEGGNGKWKFVLEAVDGSAKLEASDAEDAVSRERLELLVVVRGLEALPQPARVTLITASRYVCRGIRFGLSAWRENNWQWEHFGQMLPVKHADLWQRLDRAMRIHDVRCRTLRLDPAHHEVEVKEPRRGAAAPECKWHPRHSDLPWDFASRAGRWMKSWLGRSHVRAAQLL